MRVDRQRYRVLSRWRVFWWVFPAALVCVPLQMIIVWLDRNGWWQGYLVIPLMALVFGIWSITFGIRVLRDGFLPPRGSWVVEGQRVFKGRSARILGWFFIAVATSSFVLVIFSSKFLYDLSQL